MSHATIIVRAAGHCPYTSRSGAVPRKVTELTRSHVVRWRSQSGSIRESVRTGYIAAPSVCFCVYPILPTRASNAAPATVGSGPQRDLDHLGHIGVGDAGPHRAALE